MRKSFRVVSRGSSWVIVSQSCNGNRTSSVENLNRSFSSATGTSTNIYYRFSLSIQLSGPLTRIIPTATATNMASICIKFRRSPLAAPLVVTLLFLSSSILPCSVVASKQSDPCVHLTAENFNEQTQGKMVFVKFYAPWCGHCQMLKPDYEKLCRK